MSFRPDLPPKTKKPPGEGWLFSSDDGRDGEIRTLDLLLPKQALYQAKLRPEIIQESGPMEGKGEGRAIKILKRISGGTWGPESSPFAPRSSLSSCSSVVLGFAEERSIFRNEDEKEYEDEKEPGAPPRLPIGPPPIPVTRPVRICAQNGPEYAYDSLPSRSAESVLRSAECACATSLLPPIKNTIARAGIGARLLTSDQPKTSEQSTAITAL